MVIERLQPGSTIGLFDSIKNVTVKLKDRVIQLGDDANTWRKIAIISDSREIDRVNIIGNCQLTVTPRCLMDRKQVMQWLPWEIETANCTKDCFWQGQYNESTFS